MVCSGVATQVCVNCQVAYCPQHVLGRSCAGCSSQLWLLQAKHVRWLGFLYALTAIPITIFSMFLGPLTFGIVLPALLLGSFALPKLSRPLLDRFSARKTLSPTSQAMQLTPHIEPVTEPVVESAYNKRRRNSAPGSPKTSILGSFYKL